MEKWKPKSFRFFGGNSHLGSKIGGRRSLRKRDLFRGKKLRDEIHHFRNLVREVELGN